MKTFDIIEEPWIDVVQSDGIVRTLSLRALLMDLHHIDRLSESSPLTEVALLRFLIALVSDGLRDFVPDESAWLPFVKQCRDGLPDAAINAILEPLLASANVLAVDHVAFFDGPLVRQVNGWDEPNARQPVSRFLPELPTGTNLAHFSHLTDDAAALCVACLLKSRAVDAAFARGGLGPSLSRNLLATISGTEPRYVVLEAKSLLDTILTNLAIGDSTRPSWVHFHSRQDGEPGPIARMSWRPRLMLPITSSESQLPCVACASTTRPRFTQAVMVDSYNFVGSPFGSKDDLERWKSVGGDPQILPIGKNVLSLGLSSNEWSLRALTRLLTDETGGLHSLLLKRCVVSGQSVSIRVISSAGNQAKIDDAPADALPIPAALLTRSSDELAAVGAALSTIFEKEYRVLRERLIPHAASRLLSTLACTPAPAVTVQEWLESGRPAAKETRPRITDGSHTIDGRIDGTSPPFESKRQADTLTKAANRIIRELAALPRAELLALRPVGRGGAVDRAARQAAFEAVWHRLSLPGTAKRHAVRESLVTVAGIFGVHSDCHRLRHERFAFQTTLTKQVIRQRTRSGREHGVSRIERLHAQLIKASPTARDALLLQLVDELVSASDVSHRRVIDFADLLIDVAMWNDPHDPTPVRWNRCLVDAACAGCA